MTLMIKKLDPIPISKERLQLAGSDFFFWVFRFFE
jgi:hypothetical protein